MESEKYFEQFHPEIGLAKSEDLADIIRLQQENLYHNFSEEEKQKNGFVSIETPPELLQEIANEEGITVARDKGKTIGYLMPISVEHCQKIPLLDSLIEKLATVKFEGKPLNEYRHCVLGQVCIDKSYRGTGILEQLYQNLETRLADTYDLGVSEIGANNPRSLRAHSEKIGLKIIEQYSAAGRDWYIVVLDFRPYRK